MECREWTIFKGLGRDSFSGSRLFVLSLALFLFIGGHACVRRIVTGIDSGPLAFLIWLLDGCYALSLYGISACAASRITFERLKGNVFFGTKEAILFALGRWRALLGVPVLLLVLFLVLNGFIFMAGRAAGSTGIQEILLSLFSIPLWCCAFFLMFWICVMLVAFAFTPTIIAWRGDISLEVLFQAFSMTFRRPASLFLNEMRLLLIAGWWGALFGVVASLAWAGWIWLVSLRAVHLSEAPGVLRLMRGLGTLCLRGPLGFLLALFSGGDATRLSETLHTVYSGMLLLGHPFSLVLSGISITVIGTLILSFPLAVVVNGHCRLYLHVRGMDYGWDLPTGRSRGEKKELPWKRNECI